MLICERHNKAVKDHTTQEWLEDYRAAEENQSRLNEIKEYIRNPGFKGSVAINRIKKIASGK